MKWLLWKDYRHNRLVVFATLFLLVAPYLIAVGATWYDWWHYGRPIELQLTRNLIGASLYGLLMSQLAIALIGGNAIAGERVDRSSEFLFSLPIARTKLLASKLLLALAIAATIWLTNAVILWYFWGDPVVQRDLPRFGEVLANAAITALVFFCVAWFLSSFIASPTIAVCGGLITPLIVGSGLFFVDYLFEYHIHPDVWVAWYRCICLTIAPLCFAVGTWHYLRRVEP